MNSTVVTLGLCTDLPNYVRETLSLGPKSAVLDKVNPKNILTELDLLLDFCKRHEIEDSVITDINNFGIHQEMSKAEISKEYYHDQALFKRE